MAKKKVFVDLQQALTDALAYERREKLDLRATELPPPAKRLRPREIRNIRHSLHASQAVFAQLIGASAPLVRAWEQGDRRPSAMARRLLDEVRRDPDRWAAMLKDARRQPAA